MSNERRLSAEQIAEASRLRAEAAMPWRHIAEHFGVDVKTIRRHCDPNFDRTISGNRESYGMREDEKAHRVRMYGDLQFKLRALHVRKRGYSEAAHLVPQMLKAPCTDYARFITAPAHVRRSSAIADC